jgi:hypothetical protein
MSRLFNDPGINRQILVEITRMRGRAVEMDAECKINDLDSFIVENLVESLDVHARAYLELVNEDCEVAEYTAYLRNVGLALIHNQETRGLLSDPNSEQQLRKMAESSIDVVSKRFNSDPNQYEAALQNQIEKIRIELMPETLKWQSRKTQLLHRISSRTEARILSWTADAMERCIRRRNVMDGLHQGNAPANPDPTSGAEPRDRSHIEALLAHAQAVWMRSNSEQKTRFDQDLTDPGVQNLSFGGRTHKALHLWREHVTRSVKDRIAAYSDVQQQYHSQKCSRRRILTISVN